MLNTKLLTDLWHSFCAQARVKESIDSYKSHLYTCFDSSFPFDDLMSLFFDSIFIDFYISNSFCPKHGALTCPFLYKLNVLEQPKETDTLCKPFSKGDCFLSPKFKVSNDFYKFKPYIGAPKYICEFYKCAIEFKEISKKFNPHNTNYHVWDFINNNLIKNWSVQPYINSPGSNFHKTNTIYAFLNLAHLYEDQYSDNDFESYFIPLLYDSMLDLDLGHYGLDILHKLESTSSDNDIEDSAHMYACIFSFLKVLPNSGLKFFFADQIQRMMKNTAGTFNKKDVIKSREITLTQYGNSETLSEHYVDEQSIRNYFEPLINHTLLIYSELMGFFEYICLWTLAQDPIIGYQPSQGFDTTYNLEVFEKDLEKALNKANVGDDVEQSLSQDNAMYFVDLIPKIVNANSEIYEEIILDSLLDTYTNPEKLATRKLSNSELTFIKDFFGYHKERSIKPDGFNPYDISNYGNFS